MTTKWPYVVLLLAFAGAACHKRPPAVSPSAAPAPPQASAPAAPPRPAPPSPRAAAPQRPAALSEEEQFRRKSLAELNAEHPLGDAFFDYDQDTLRDDARQALQKDAAWLTKWTQTTISLEGYCDERGTAEYNLALGDRRATAAKAYLESLGVASNRIHTVSRGKEGSFCQGESEACWAQNRRGHFVITGK